MSVHIPLFNTLTNVSPMSWNMVVASTMSVVPVVVNHVGRSARSPTNAWLSTQLSAFFSSSLANKKDFLKFLSPFIDKPGKSQCQSEYQLSEKKTAEDTILNENTSSKTLKNDGADASLFPTSNITTA